MHLAPSQIAELPVSDVITIDLFFNEEARIISEKASEMS